MTEFSEADILHTLDLRMLLEAYAIEKAGPNLSQKSISRFDDMLREEATVLERDTLDMHRYVVLS